MANDGVIETMLDILQEQEETETDRGIAYCMSMLCSMGGAGIFIKSGGIEKLAPLMKNDDEMTSLYTLFTLNTISSMGYQMEILETKVNKFISYHMPENKEIETLSQMLLDDLYNWREESFIIGEDQLEIMDPNQELIGLDDGYVRPDIKKQRIEPRDGILLGYDGKEIHSNVDKEEIIELKRRKLENYKRLKNKDQEVKDTIGKRGKKVREKAGPVGVKRVKQRVVKKRPEIITPVERKVVNVTGGSLDELSIEKTPTLTDPDTPIEIHVDINSLEATENITKNQEPHPVELKNRQDQESL